MSDLVAILSADSSQLQKALNDAKTVLNRYKKETTKTTSVTKEQVEAFNKSVNSLNKLTNSAKTNSQQSNGLKKQLIELTTQYRGLDETARNSEFGHTLERTIRQTQARYKELQKTVEDVNNSIKKTEDNAKSVKDVLNQMSQKTVGVDFSSFSKVGAIVGGVGLLANEIKRSTEMAIKFEDALSNLSAITGMQGKELDKLKDQIIETGNATSKSFDEIADSYTKVGSKMPELLKQPKALDEVTRAVLTLGEAARMTVDDATESLLGIMNQMGASASEASTYINVLAAGSKNGAGDIKYLAEAFNQCGTASATAGLTIQQATALIEVLAQKIPSASTAGTNLRNILLKLATDTDNTINPTVVGLSTALQNLAKHADDTAYMTKKFGSENVSAAITLAESAAKADELTRAVTGTNEAEVQAQIQTDNVAGSVRKLRQDWDNFIAALNGSTGVLNSVIKLLDKVILGYKNALNAKSQYENNKTSAAKGEDNAESLIIGNKNNAKGKTAEQKLKSFQQQTRSDISFYEGERRKTLDKITSKVSEAERKSYSQLAANYEGTINALKKSLETVKIEDFKATVILPKTGTVNTSGTTQTTTTNSGKTKGGKGTSTSKTAKKTVLTDNEKAIKEYEHSIKNLNELLKDGYLTGMQHDLAVVKEQNDLIRKLSSNWIDATDAQKEYFKNINQEKNTKLSETIKNTNGVDLFKQQSKVEVKEIRLPKVDTQIDTIEEYDAAIKKLTEDLAKLVIGSAEYKKVLDEVSSLQTKKAESMKVAETQTKGLSENTLNAAEGIGQMGSALSNLGNAVQIPELNFAGVMAQAIANMVLSYSQALTQASTLGPWAWVGFGATGLAELATIISTTKSIGKFAQGGIVDGPTSVGDFNIARVNGGEMILNNGQQARLFHMLNGNGGNTSSSAKSSEVHFRINGRDLVGVLNNYNISNSKLR